VAVFANWVVWFWYSECTGYSELPEPLENDETEADTEAEDENAEVENRDD